MFQIKLFFIFVIFYNFCFASTRVSFSRPGEMMRIPSIDYSLSRKFLNINFSHESLSSKQGNSNVSITSISKSGAQYGISFATPANPNNSSELGFHYQKNIYIHGNLAIDLGVHDIVWRQGNYTTTGLDTRDVSFFAILSNQKSIENYTISTHFGLGTGKIVNYSQLENINAKQTIGAFFGFQFKTPLLRKENGLTFITEFDGKGLNIGLKIPFLKLYQLNLGIAHFDNFGNYGTEDKNGADYAALKSDAPAIAMGITINIPRIYNEYSNKTNIEPVKKSIYTKTDSSILFYNPICTDVVENLKDSIRLGNDLIENLKAHNVMLLHQGVVLVDSTRKNSLNNEISKIKENEAMRHLSRSLRHFYNEKYRDALSEVNLAIEANPKLAIAYGRRGSIYFKLGDEKRATLNWNVALQLDPEFIEIYEMLKAYDENLLKSIEMKEN